MISHWKLLSLLVLIISVFVLSAVDEQKFKRQANPATRIRNRAVRHAMDGDCKQAIVAYREIIALGDAAATADDFNNLGVCLQEEGRQEEAVATYQSGIKKFYHNEKLHKNLGELLEDMSKADLLGDHGEGWTEETDRRSVLSISHLSFALRLHIARLWEKWGQDAPKQKRIGLGKPTVALYTRQRSEEGMEEGQWGPSLVYEDGESPEHGEEAVIFLSRHLVKLGFNVEVYGNPPERERGMDEHGVMWFPYWAIHPMLPPVWNETHVLWPKLPQRPQPSVFLSLGNYEAAHLFNSSVHEARNITPPVSYLWMHSMVSAASAFTPSFAASLHGIIVNSRFQAAMMPRRIAHCLTISQVGVEQEAPFVIRQSHNFPHRFVYGGSPLNGLDILLALWPSIRRGIKERQGAAASSKEGGE
eukprot:CAMPEP_0181343534 /NCGR_PEP_ID=MMETSP1101-20121128/31640_1 /TAXON_ID=46948 /ORGANISM="Rhodomonas abbreviata, Strain Caron Lab Isolate" /LENGTH=416 /DNA_ID=CAMNT_0023455175 /DNA_START=229 /DNA_END=1476 /DNA_ORIENTATION=-